MALPFKSGMEAIKQAASNGGSKTYKLKNAGDKAILWFAQDLDQIVTFKEHGLGSGKDKRYYICIGEDCPLCEAGIKLRDRAMPQIITPEGKLDFWKISGNTLKLLITYYEKYGTLQDRPYEVIRTSDNFNPYQIIPEDKMDMPDKYKKLIENLKDPADAVRIYSRQELIVKLNAANNDSNNDSQNEDQDPTENF